MFIDIRQYFKNLKYEYILAFVSTFCIALLAHLYRFTNTLPNHDALYNYYSDQNAISLGRWALSFSCGISSFFDLPWINGLLSCAYIAVTASVVIAVLEISDPILILLTGGLLSTSVGITQTFFYLYTADGYMLAMLLAALGVYYSRIEENRKSRVFIAGACICIACGIYQAYVSFALILALCYMLSVLLSQKYDKRTCYRWIVRQIILYIAALAGYYLIWKLSLMITGTAANDYQGISNVGSIGFNLLVNGIINSIKSTLVFFLQWDIFKHGLTLYGALSILFLISAACGLIIAFINSGIYKIKWSLLLAVLCIVAIIPFACIWCFVSESIVYRAMMLQSYVLLFIMTGQLYVKWANKSILTNCLGTLLIAIILNNTIMANISYFYMQQSYERTYGEGLEMMIRIHDLEAEYNFDKIAIIGNRNENESYITADSLNSMKYEDRLPGKIHILSSSLEKTLLLDEFHTYSFLGHTFGLDLEIVNSKEKEILLNDSEITQMKTWPDKSSIKVIGNILVIKLSDDITAY